eukprot:9484302-Pyramimonas_sp.AAC.1
MYALPVVSMQHVREDDGNASQRLTCASRFSFPPQALHQPRDLGHEVEARRLEVFSGACLLRAAINPPKFHELMNILQEFASSDEVNIKEVHCPSWCMAPSSTSIRFQNAQGGEYRPGL